MSNYTSDWFSHNIPKWKEFVLPLFAYKPYLTFLEVGCYEGKATTWMLENLLTEDTSNIIVVDTFQGGYEHQLRYREELVGLEERFRVNIKPWKQKVKINKCKSEELAIFCALDLIYVDGSHLACDVLYDGMKYWRLLKKGGVMIFDDYEWVGEGLDKPLSSPKLGIDMFLQVNEGQYVVLDKGYQVILQKL